MFMASVALHVVAGVLVGLWEGVVLNHFVQRMPRSFDPYIALGFRVFVDFLFTQSMSRMALVALWTVVGMLLADIAPNVWRDSGLRRLYRRVRREVRHIKRAVPVIRIKNDIPTVRLFSRRTSSTVVSIRSDRATPAQSPAPGTTPMPGPPRRLGAHPPGTFPGSSGWSETGTEITTLRGRIVMSPGPSPAIIPTRIGAQLQYTDTSNVATPHLPITELHNPSILLGTDGPATTSGTIIHVDEASRDPPTIPEDDWVDVTPPLRPELDAPVIPPFPGLREPVADPSSVTVDPTHLPLSVIEPTPRISTIPDIPDAFPSGSDACQVPLPESRAATVIGGAEEQPHGVWRSAIVARMEKAYSEFGADPLRPVAPYPAIRTSDMSSKARSENAVGDPEPQTITPTQVDPTSDGGVAPVDAPPPPEKSDESIPPTPHPAAIIANTNPVPDRDTMGPSSATEPLRDATYLDPDPPYDPPPPFSEAVGEAGAQVNSDPVTQDEQPTGLTGEHKITEERRQTFLIKELSKQEAERDRLQGKLESKPKNLEPLKLKMDEVQDSLRRIKARISKTQFCGENSFFLWQTMSKFSTDAPESPIIVDLKPRMNGPSVKEVSDFILNEILQSNHTGSIYIQIVIKKQKQKVESSLREFAEEYVNGPTSVQTLTHRTLQI